MKYFQHKENPDVICEVVGKKARFSKWVWRENICVELYKVKDVSNDFNNSFNEITQQEFNKVWGNKLEQV